MYGFNYPPPPFWGYQQPNVSPGPMPQPSDLERGMKIAMKIRMKEERKDEKKKEAETKKKEEEKKKAGESKGKNLLSVEWLILGWLSYPIMGPLYRMLTNNLEVFSHAVK